MDTLKETEPRRERRSEGRETLQDYYSVEFSVARHLPVHQFRVRNLSPWGMGILIKGDSAALERLKVGEVLEMTYHYARPSIPSEHLRTEIRHITRLNEGPFKGHYLVGLRILDRRSH